MSSMRVLLLGAAIVAGSTLQANSADLYGGSIKDAPVMMAAPAHAGWYLRGDGAWASYNVGDVSIVDQGLINPPSTIVSSGGDIDNGWAIGGGFGRYFGSNFRGDLTLEYRSDVDVSGTANACCSLATQTSVHGVVGLANLYYDFNRGGPIVPYIGGGLGFARLKTGSGVLGCDYDCQNNFGDATYEGTSKTNFAIAGMAGVSVKLRGGEASYVGGGMKDAPVMVEGGRALYLDVGYRFLHLGDIETDHALQTNGNQLDVGWDNLNAHEVRVGLRYDLN